MRNGRKCKKRNIDYKIIALLAVLVIMSTIYVCLKIRNNYTGFTQIDALQETNPRYVTGRTIGMPIYVALYDESELPEENVDKKFTYVLTPYGISDVDGDITLTEDIPMPSTNMLELDCPTATGIENRVGYGIADDDNPWKLTFPENGTFVYLITQLNPDKTSDSLDDGTWRVYVNVDDAGCTITAETMYRDPVSTLKESEFTFKSGLEAGGKFSSESGLATLIIGGDKYYPTGTHFDSAAVKSNFIIDFNKDFELVGFLTAPTQPDGCAIGFVPTPQIQSSVPQGGDIGIYGPAENKNGIFLEIDSWGNTTSSAGDKLVKDSFASYRTPGRHIALAVTGEDAYPSEMYVHDENIDMPLDRWPQEPTDYKVTYSVESDVLTFILGDTVYTYSDPKSVFGTNEAYLVMGGNIRQGPANSSEYVIFSAGQNVLAFKDFAYIEHDRYDGIDCLFINSLSEHDWVYVGHDNIIDAYCTLVGCEYYSIENAIQLILTTPGMTYTGKEYDLAEVENNITAITGALEGKIIYYLQDGETKTNTSNSNSLYDGGPPADIGKYIAKISLGGETAVSSFEITKVEPKLTVVPKGIETTYNGTNQELIIQGTVDGGTLYYRVGENGTWTNKIPTAMDQAKYTIYYYISGDKNHLNLGTKNNPLGSVNSIIYKKDITEQMVTIDKDEYEYENEEITPVITVEDIQKILVDKNEVDSNIIFTSDYEISGDLKAKEPGDYVITITATEDGNYKGSVDVPWKIVRNNYKYTVEYYYNGVIDNSKTDEFEALYLGVIDTYLDKNIEGYKLEKEVEPITISKNEEENIMKVYYVIDESNTKDLKYTVRYFKDGEEVTEDKIERTSTVQVLQPDTLNIVTEDITITGKYTGYKFEKMNLNSALVAETPRIAQNEDIIDVYYVKDDFKYTVEYYYNGVKDNTKTEELSARYGDTITEYTDKNIIGYRLEKDVEPVVITEDESKNIMKVYYVIDDSNTKNLKYTVRYFKDGEEVTEDKIERTSTVQVLQPDTLNIVTEDITITGKYTGYKFEKVNLNSALVAETPRIAQNGDIIDVYYVKDDFKYTVEYYYNGVKDYTKTEESSAKYGDTITEYTDKNIIGYRLEKDVEPIVITEDESKNIMKVYYVIDDSNIKNIQYTVRYFKDGEEAVQDKVVRTKTVQILENDSLDIVDGDINVENKYVGYKYDKLDVNTTATTSIPTIAQNGDVFDVYYIKDTFKYSVEYYYDGVKDDSKTDELSALYGDVISTYKDKVIPGFKLEKEVVAVKITENESQNVMKVYYVTDSANLKEVCYFVKYFKDGVEVLEDKIVESKTVQLNDYETMQVNRENINIVDKYDGYYLEKIQLNDNDINDIPEIVNNNDTINVYYASFSSQITVKFEDRNGNKIKESMIFKSFIDDTLNLDEIDDNVDSYILYTKTSQGTIKYTEGNQEVIFVYDKIAKVIVKYLDSQNAQDLDVSENYEIDGVVGNNYSTLEKEFEGYILVQKPNNAQGVMTEDVIEVVYYYAVDTGEIIVDPDSKDDPAPENPIEDNSIGDDTKNVEENNEESPNTSDINLLLLVLIFVVSLVILNRKNLKTYIKSNK